MGGFPVTGVSRTMVVPHLLKLVKGKRIVKVWWVLVQMEMDYINRFLDLHLPYPESINIK